MKAKEARELSQKNEAYSFDSLMAAVKEAAENGKYEISFIVEDYTPITNTILQFQQLGYNVTQPISENGNKVIISWKEDYRPKVRTFNTESPLFNQEEINNLYKKRGN